MKIVQDILVGPNETDMEKPRCPGGLESLESDLSQWLLKVPPDSADL